jgi:hypothetical protein
MDQRFSKARVAQCESLTTLTSGRTETPNRKYKILGVIDESHKHGYLPGRFDRFFSDFGDRESAIAKVAHKQGGDAVIFVARAQEPSGVDQYGNGHHRRSTELVVVKYVDEPKPY